MRNTARFCDTQTEVDGRYVGKYESKVGSYTQYYADVAKAIQGGEQVVRFETSRDGIKLCEVARLSALKRTTLDFASRLAPAGLHVFMCTRRDVISWAVGKGVIGLISITNVPLLRSWTLARR